MNHSRLLLALCAIAAGGVQAQDDSPDPGQARGPGCTAAEYRQFDFWVGHWNVTSGGQPAGVNHIETLHDGCALAEHWTSAVAGFSGSSLNAYDRVNNSWHQTWVDTSGTLLRLDGGMVEGNMVLDGQGVGPDGKPVTHRITWTPNADGSVRQHWQTSTDGQNWTTAFDGHYLRAGEAE